MVSDNGALDISQTKDPRANALDLSIDYIVQDKMSLMLYSQHSHRYLLFVALLLIVLHYHAIVA